MSQITTCTNLIKPYLPSWREAGLTTVATAGTLYLAGIPAAITALACYTGYKLVFSQCRTNSLERIQEKLNQELFKRLPKALKETILAESVTPISREQVALLQDPTKWNNLEIIRKTAIRACLEGKIDEKELSYVMVHCMVLDNCKDFPQTQFFSSKSRNFAGITQLLSPLCQSKGISTEELLGVIGDDPFFVVQTKCEFDIQTPYHHTAKIAYEQYPFSLKGEGSLKRAYVFLPHTYEKLLAHFYPDSPEKPLSVYGTKEVERLSHPTHRVLSMTGGTTIPTPNIEANEARALPFYLHDCYHLEIDSAIGPDRVFWNGLGVHLLKFAKEQQDPDRQLAFQTLGEFVLDKEFEPYRIGLPKNQAFLLPFLGMHEVAGKKATEDQNDPFKPIGDASFTESIRNDLFAQIGKFWRQQAHMLKLRGDLTKTGLLKSIPALQKLNVEFPPIVLHCIEGLAELQDETDYKLHISY